MKKTHFKVAVVGCGSIGLASAYYLARNHGIHDIALIDSGQPMAFTSAQSGENYRNWWPHPSMVAFTNRSIDLLEDIARQTDNRINMNRRGYVLASRNDDISELIGQLHEGLGDDASRLLRYHEDAQASQYERPLHADWQGVRTGVDILRNQDLIRSVFPSYAEDIQSIIHIRRGGDISGQQLGMVMLEYLKSVGARRVSGEVKAIRADAHFALEVNDEASGTLQITADKLVNAAGPFAAEIADMLGQSLPVFNTFQQKIAFEDRAQAIPRDMPFSIDLDEQQIDWLPDERELLLEEPDFAWLAETMPGAIHCRPDGGDNGSWIKLGWAYNDKSDTPSRDLPLDENFPEVVLHGAARLNPSLKAYYGQLPRNMHHYGGWYTMTDENWPLIGPMATEGAFMNCAMSGFGTMSACAAGELCAAWVADAERPAYARDFSLARRDDAALMQQLHAGSKGIL
ncbi:NAD(P)/FAD-dependent oxidoreductase [Granulosicoccus sp. 3-233]|uniref:NAD(P)/FAD-dependent oxidoreductase n=1 Tax=Granulosicoccus sp. 3-233 TaxID=3417969 RepID=UPI003D327160